MCAMHFALKENRNRILKYAFKQSLNTLMYNLNFNSYLPTVINKRRKKYGSINYMDIGKAFWFVWVCKNFQATIYQYH